MVLRLLRGSCLLLLHVVLAFNAEEAATLLPDGEIGRPSVSAQNQVAAEMSPDGLMNLKLEQHIDVMQRDRLSHGSRKSTMRRATASKSDSLGWVRRVAAVGASSSSSGLPEQLENPKVVTLEDHQASGALLATNFRTSWQTVVQLAETVRSPPPVIVFLWIGIVLMMVLLVIVYRNNKSLVESEVERLAHDLPHWDSPFRDWNYGLLMEESRHNTLRDMYDVGDKLGEGAFGVVHEVFDKQTGEGFAVKMIDLASSEKEWVTLEIEQMQRVEHELLTVRIVEIFEDHCFVYLVMPKYSGGDLFEGIMDHVYRKGIISETLFIKIHEQQMSALAFVHSRRVVHRDIKPENFLMTKKDLQDPSLRVVLTDFGLSEELATGEMLSDLCGSPCFWSPEIIKGSYDFAVDVFALGLTAYILVTGCFAFDTPHQIRSWASSSQGPPIPEHVSVPTVELFQAALERDPQKRCTAQEGLELLQIHPLFGGIEEETAHRPLAPEHMKKLASFRVDVPDEVLHRRALMVNELDRQQEEKEQQNDAATLGMTKRSSLQARRSSDGGKGRRASIDMNAKVRMLQGLPFVLAGKLKDQTHYEWWSQQQCEELNIIGVSDQGLRKRRFSSDNAEAGHQDGNAGFENVQVTDADITLLEQILDRFNLDKDQFGVGDANTLTELGEECKDGRCSLLEDGKHLVRMVDLVVPILTEADGMILVEKSKVINGSRKMTNRFPAKKALAWESTQACALRALAGAFQFQPEEVSCDVDTIKVQILKDESPSYPGMVTVYRRRMVTVHIQMDIMSASRLAKIGLPNANDFDNDGSRWGWHTEEECEGKGLVLKGNGAMAAWYAALPPAKPRPWNPRTNEGIQEREALEAKLQRCGVDISQYGDDKLDQLTQEVILGKSDLVEQRSPNGQMNLLRIVVVTLLRLYNTSGTLLVETAKTARGDTRKQLDRLPAIKQASYESPFVSARREFAKLGLNEDEVEFDRFAGGSLQEKQDSGTYPGLSTLYQKNVVSASMVVAKAVHPATVLRSDSNM